MTSARNPFGPRGWTPDRIGNLDGRTYVITGTTAGAGFQATRELLAKGARVVMLNRNAQKSAATIASLQEEFGADVPVSAIAMDLAELASVREAAAQVLKQVGRIDALMCNAAIAQIPTRKLTSSGFESQFGVNHLGHFLLSGLLFDRIEESSGRIVVVGSNGYKMGLKRIQFDDLSFEKDYSAWNAYSQSKLAQMMFAYELQRRVAAVGGRTQVQVCHPGASRTDLITTGGSMLTRITWKLMTPFAQSAQKGSWPEVMCATEDNLAAQTLYGPTKRMETVGAIGECPLDEIALDRDAAKRLWAESEAMVSLEWSPR